MTLWGAKVSSNKPVILESTETRAVSVMRAALVRGLEAVLNIEIEGIPFSLGTLQKDKKSNFDLSEVHLTGYYHLPNEISEDKKRRPF